ncbi:hypothetical protein PV10_07792 [Exophiala mesophila]|uniref:Uncharacterized protein n=1 Tax=Exophiala mesophila TaxID=212818 RepID=A0A0D1XQX9_EXOME|nr:uncharacterized protein PV10_07792 [Exophiala mesophila]KIV90491.1 hypothetical protein PV10_07792 [Exophiala mesophila]
MAAIHQTIAIVDRSNKVVGTSKQLKNVFKEAKMAYLERKAEIVAERRAREDRELRKALKAASIADDARSQDSRRPTKHRSHRREDHRHHRSPSEHTRRPPELRRRSHQSDYHESHRSHSGSVSPSIVHEQPSRHVGLADFNEDLQRSTRAAPSSPPGPQLVRRNTEMPVELHRAYPPLARANSTSELDHVDMDLAYGEYHADSLRLAPQVEQKLQKQEMSSLVTKCKILLDEANCAQHSVKAIVAHLQKNPDAMAAVALTLAEISNLATKMAPAALASFKTAAPAVFAILASPQFLVAVGVGVGLTVVMFGGYKVIKKIKAASGNEQNEGADEMLDVQELERIDNWRRGIPGAETASVATSVEGEFITPLAAASVRDLRQSRRDVDDSREKKRSDKKRHQHRARDDDGMASIADSESTSHSKHSSRRKAEKKEKALVKVHKPSPLRRIFSSRD